MEPSFSGAVNSNRKIQIKALPKLQKRQNEEASYWKNFKFPILHICSGAVNSIDFCQTSPHDYAIASSSTVQIFDPITNKPKKNLSRFKNIVNCATFRKDGKLLLTGGAEKKIRLIDLSTKSFLRSFHGHSDAVTTTRFINSDNTKMYSSSYDKTVRLWDISSEKVISTFSSHKDQVRSCYELPGNSSIIVSGSYDHTIKMWDTRSNDLVMSFNQEDPVEAILLFPHGGALVSSGGNKLSVWDIIAGKKLIDVSNHQKTITTLAFDGNKSHLLSGSIDHHVKIYDLHSYKVTYSIKYPSPVLHLALSPNDTHFVVGMSDGVVSIKTHLKKDKNDQLAFPAPSPGTFRYFMRGKTQKPKNTDFQVIEKKKKGLKSYERLIRKYRYKDALDSVLLTNNTVAVVSLIEELQRRNGMKKALMGRDDLSLRPILQFVYDYLLHPHYHSSLFSVASILLDLYTGVVGQSPMVYDLLKRLQKKLHKEIIAQQKLYSILGSLELILSTAMLAKEEKNIAKSFEDAEIQMKEESKDEDEEKEEDNEVPNGVSAE